MLILGRVRQAAGGARYETGAQQRRGAPAPVPEPRTRAPRRAEILASLSLAIDLGLGQPMEHMLRSCTLGLRIADVLGFDAASRRRLYYTHLLAWIGCHADSAELAALFGDDIDFRADYYTRDPRGLPLLALMLGHVGTGLPVFERTGARVRFTLGAASTLRTLIASHCRSAGILATGMGLDQTMASILSCTFERWDGAGLPVGAAGRQIPVEMRIMQLADTVEVHLRTAGPAAAAEMVSQRRGTHFDPALADLYLEHAAGLTADLSTLDPWAVVLEHAPAEPGLEGTELDAVLRAIGDFADLKSPERVGHSRGVAQLASTAAALLGLGPGQVTEIRRAGWIHDVGRLGVSNRVRDAGTELSLIDAERLRLYPQVTENIIGRVPALRGIARIAGAHRELLDGSGHPRGLTAAGLDVPQRLLAAADELQESLEPRAHRPALQLPAAAALLGARASAGMLDRDAVAAVLEAAGQRNHRVSTHPAGLTDRELQVLRLICRGSSGRDIGAALSISPKTARNHIEHIYTKTGAVNRVGATLFALDKGLWDRTGDAVT